jgi:transposase
VLDERGFDAFVEAQCAPFYAATLGRPSLTPGTYFRLLLIGYFEGIDSERGIAWRTADSLALRGFLGLGLNEAPPEHSTISRTRRLIDLETHRAVFTWILQVLATKDLVRGKTIGIDATTLEANAALRSIVRRDSGETYQEFLTRLAQASGIETPTRADLARLDRKRPKKGRNTDWRHPHDPDARITKMKDGRTHLAHKAEHAVDMETGAIVGVTVQGADQGDTTTIAETVTAAADDLEAVAAVTDGATAVIDEVVADKGYHSNQVLVDLAQLDVRTYIAEPRSRPTHVEEESRGSRCRLREPAADPWHARSGPVAATQRAAGTTECASLRDRRAPSDASAGSHEHPETVAGPRRGVQPRPLYANALWHRHTTEPPGAAGSGACGVRRALVARGRPVGPCETAIRRSVVRLHAATPVRAAASPSLRQVSLATAC